MMGLLDEYASPLAALYSNIDRAKRYAGGLLSDPVGRAEQTAGQIVDGGPMAFADKLMSMAPMGIGMVKQIKNPLGENMVLAPSTSATSNVRRMLDSRSNQGVGVIPATDKHGGFFVTVDGLPVFREATQAEANAALKDVDINFWRGELSNIYGNR